MTTETFWASAISRTIKTLESDLGTPLFRRSTRRQQLTPEGERFYRDCVEMLQRFAQVTQQCARIFRDDTELDVRVLAPKGGQEPGRRDGVRIDVIDALDSDTHGWLANRNVVRDGHQDRCAE